MVLTDEKNRLVRAQMPEQAGIRREAVMKMLAHLEKKKEQYHSLMIVRNGMVAAECYAYPFQKDISHTMFSVSKTITATAIGLAVQEGYLRLSDRVTKFFPQGHFGKDRQEYYQMLTIRNLLNMTAGKVPNYTPNKIQKNWLPHFFHAKWDSKPGTKFAYMNENTYLLSVILTRVTGQSMVDYLMPRFFEPLGIERPVWETDANGIAAGGWGSYLKTEDLAKIMLCYAEGGCWQGRQIIPKSWCQQASYDQAEENEPVRKQGYGYGIWVRNENEYNAGGMFTQIGYVFEKENCVVSYTSCAPSEQTFDEALDILRSEGFCPVEDIGVPVQAFEEELLMKKADILEKSEIVSPLRDKLDGKTIHVLPDLFLNFLGFPPSMLHLAWQVMAHKRAGNMTNMQFEFGTENGTIFRWREGRDKNAVCCSSDGTYSFSSMKLAGIPFTAATHLCWVDENTLLLQLRPVESLCQRNIQFRFYGKFVRIKLSSSPDSEVMIDSIRSGAQNVFRELHLQALFRPALNLLLKIVDVTLWGYMN